MKTNDFLGLIEDTQRGICQSRHALVRYLNSPENKVITEEHQEQFAKAINGLYGMKHHIHVALGYDLTVPNYVVKLDKDEEKRGEQDVVRIAKHKQFGLKQTKETVVSEILSVLRNARDLVQKFNKKDYAQQYKNLVNPDNTKIELTSKYFDQQRSTLVALNKVVETVEGFVAEMAPLEE